MGHGKKYELRPRMRLEALLLPLALAGLTIRAEVVDYGKKSGFQLKKKEKGCYFDRRETEKSRKPVSKNCGKSCYRR